MKKYDFTYTIKQIDLQECNVLVEYLPTNTALSKYVFNVAAYIPNDAGELKTIDQMILDNAPHLLWGAQELLINQHDTLINKTETITSND